VEFKEFLRFWRDFATATPKDTLNQFYDNNQVMGQLIKFASIFLLLLLQALRSHSSKKPTLNLKDLNYKPDGAPKTFDNADFNYNGAKDFTKKETEDKPMRREKSMNDLNKDETGKIDEKLEQENKFVVAKDKQAYPNNETQIGEGDKEELQEANNEEKPGDEAKLQDPSSVSPKT
jgi:hypothetical protein